MLCNKPPQNSVAWTISFYLVCELHLSCIGEMFPLGLSVQNGTATSLGALLHTPLPPPGTRSQPGQLMVIAEKQETKHKHKIPFQASAGITPSSIPLAKASHLLSPVLRSGQSISSRSQLQIPTARGVDKGMKDQAISVFSKFPTSIMLLFKCFILKILRLWIWEMLSIFFCRKDRPQHRHDLGQHGLMLGGEVGNLRMNVSFSIYWKGEMDKKEERCAQIEGVGQLGWLLETVNWNKIFPTVVCNSLLDPDNNLVGHTNFFIMNQNTLENRLECRVNGSMTMEYVLWCNIKCLLCSLKNFL